MSCPEVIDFLNKKLLKVDAEGEGWLKGGGVAGVSDGVKNIKKDLRFMTISGD